MNEKINYDEETLRSVMELSCILDDLKLRVRTGWILWRVRAKRLESVAEHCYSCLILANLLHPIYPEREQVDLAKVNRMLIFHEIGETVIGDVPLVDKKLHDAKEEAEHKAWHKLLKGLPYEDEVYDLLMEFDEHKTPESKFAFYIDKFDATKTMKRYCDSGKFHRLAWNLRDNKTIRENEDIQRLIKEGAKTSIDIWFADEYAPYCEDEFFKKAIHIIRDMNTNIKPPTL